MGNKSSEKVFESNFLSVFENLWKIKNLPSRLFFLVCFLVVNQTGTIKFMEQSDILEGGKNIVKNVSSHKEEEEMRTPDNNYEKQKKVAEEKNDMSKLKQSIQFTSMNFILF